MTNLSFIIAIIALLVVALTNLQPTFLGSEFQTTPPNVISLSLSVFGLGLLIGNLIPRRKLS